MTSNVVAIIPARGGSKGVPRKNVRPLAGRPLIAHSIQDALDARLVDAVYVTTDDPEIAEVARSCGARVIDRPEALSGDTAPSEAALLHALEAIARADAEPELVVFLQCTSPVRTGQDIDDAIRRLRAEGADSLLSVTRSHQFLWAPGEAGARPLNYDHHHRPRRQDMAPQFAENGSIYVFRPWVLRTHGNRLGGHIALYEMPEEAGLDIDSMLDLEIATLLIARNERPS